MIRANNETILIIGAGLVGLLMANLLAKQGFKLVVLDKAEPELDIDDNIGIRVSAINKVSQQLFEELGLWSHLCELRMGSYERMVVWDEGSEARIEMNAADIGETHLGFIIENHLMLKVLYEGLQAYPKSQVQFVVDSPTDIARVDEVWHIQLANGNKIAANLVIGADGAKSWLRSAVHIESSVQYFAQHALVCTVRTQQPHLYTAWQRFLATGPLAFLPLHDKHLCSIVWSTTQAQAEQLASLPDTDFNTALERAFASSLGEVKVIGFRACYPLSQHHAKQYVKSGIALIGDAAHSIHPLAGQGVNLGFADAKELASVLIQAKSKNRALASLQSLKHYERARKHYNNAIMWSMYGFNSLFSNRLSGFSRLRQFGMNLVDKQPGLKRFFIKHAMGLYK